jgi:hypothetical protein
MFYEVNYDHHNNHVNVDYATSDEELEWTHQNTEVLPYSRYNMTHSYPRTQKINGEHGAVTLQR